MNGIIDTIGNAGGIHGKEVGVTLFRKHGPPAGLLLNPVHFGIAWSVIYCNGPFVVGTPFLGWYMPVDVRDASSWPAGSAEFNESSRSRSFDADLFVLQLLAVGSLMIMLLFN